MAKLYNALRLSVQIALLYIYGTYLEEVVSMAYLMTSFALVSLAVFILSKMKVRTVPALLSMALLPWLIRLIVILFSSLTRSFYQISFDMNFFLVLAPLYICALFSWFSHISARTGRMEVLVNGFFLFLLFWKQGNYKVSIVPNPTYLAVFTICFLLVELLVLYLSVTLDKRLKKRFMHHLLEFSLFAGLLLPLVIYLLLPLWRMYEEGSVAGGGGLLKTSNFRFDFSEYIKLETEISMSDDLVLMYRKEGPAERLLLRRYVLSGYEEGQGFYRHDRDKMNPPDILIPRYTEYDYEPYKSRELNSQELFLVNIDPTAFLSLNQPINSQPIQNWDNSSFNRIYQSDAMVPTMRIFEIDPEISMDDDDFSHYTYTADDQNILSFSEEVTGDVPGVLLKTMAIERYFHENYYYSLKPGVAPDGDQLSWFMYESKKGYCSYFAFSMALMCRSIGIPARVAVGFWVDPEVSVLNFYPVRADQAHAWVEVYFSDYGWIEFDPTSSILFPGEPNPFAGFSIDEFSPLIEEILDQDLVAENLAELDDSPQQKEARKTAFETLTDALSKSWYILLSIVYLIYIFQYRYFFLFLAKVYRLPRKKSRFYYLALRRVVSFERKGYRESILEYGEKVERLYGIPFVHFSELYLKSDFSPEFGEKDLRELLQAGGNVLKHCRQEIPRSRRILHFIFPFVRSYRK